jgi:hypothetical protein
MSTSHLSTLLGAGILSIAISGCSSSSGLNGGVGGTANPPGGSGGLAAGTGGAASGGATSPSSASGGTAGSSGPAAGGTHATGGASPGGTTGAGGAAGSGGTQGPPTTGTGGRGSGGATGPSTQRDGGMVEAGGALGTTGGTGPGGGTGTGGRSNGGATGAGGRTGGIDAGSSGPCTASKSTSVSASGSGPHKVVVESNSDPDISCGTIYRPADLGGAEKYPIFAWGEGACTRSGTSNTAAMAEIASHGYFVIADGPPNGGGNCGSIAMSTDYVGMGKPLLGYITWAIAESGKSCSAYFQSLETTKIAADGFSCGGLMAAGTSGDPRMTTYGITSSGLTGADQNFYKKVHTPVKILLGGSGDIAYTNGERDYDNLSALGIPIVLFSKSGAGHGGDLSAKNGGDFTKVNLAWLNWQLKGDETATGKGFLVGSGCSFCTNSAWEVKSKNLP